MRTITEYKEAVRHNLKGLLSVSVDNTEPSFSWSPCECCDSSLGGNRYDAKALDDGGELYELSICEDCVFYITYDEIPANLQDDIKE